MNRNETKIKKQMITAIVCAYNEEETIKEVMETLISYSAVDEIIAVDDGSKDQTAAILNTYRNHFRTQIISLPSNRGKGYAMTIAAEQANGEILLFVDADLKNLNPGHLSILLTPFVNREAEMVIGFPIRGEIITPVEKLDPCRSLSGQRVVFRDDFLSLIKIIRNSGYGVETILNLHYRKHGKRVKSIFLPNLIHPIKVEKSGSAAIGEYAHEGFQILITTLKNPGLLWGAIFGLFIPYRTN